MTIYFIERSFYTPISYKVMEGITTFAMPIGYLYGGGEYCSILFVMYILHSFASLLFHLFPCEETYTMDTFFINLVAIERGQSALFRWWLYLLGLISMVIERKKSHLFVVIRVMLVILLSNTDMFTYYNWIICCLLFILSSYFMFKLDAFKTTIFCCLYHLHLGYYQ